MEIRQLPGLKWATTVQRAREVVPDLPPEVQDRVAACARSSMWNRAAARALAIPALVLTSPLMAVALVFEGLEAAYRVFDRVAGKVSDVAFAPAQAMHQRAERAIRAGRSIIQTHRQHDGNS